MEMTPCAIQEVFVDPFPQDLESLSLEEDAVSAEFAIKDTTTVKHKSALIEDTESPILVNHTGLWLQICASNERKTHTAFHMYDTSLCLIPCLVFQPPGS